ncbi:hypothetical protein AGMMS50229_14950 [Campylobacterota bacterium]|nr:hypothetical protein AGMMS50229_14950 [Campylobacterota bacterium]
MSPTKRRGFTLIELVFSLVIIAIVGMVTTEIISRVYERFAISREMELAQGEMRRVLDQIGARFQYRVKNSAIGRNTIAAAGTDEIIAIDDPALVQTVVGGATGFDMLEWVQIAYESQRGGVIPTCGVSLYDGWSGVALAGADSKMTLPFSDLCAALVIERNVMGVTAGAGPMGDAHFGTNENSPVVLVYAGRDGRGDYFSGQAQLANWNWKLDGSMSNYAGIGWSGVVPGTMESNLSLPHGTDNKPQMAVDSSRFRSYFFTREANALWVDADKRLKLYTHYQPWHGDTGNGSYKNGQESTLLEHVTRFLFSERGGVVRLVLCVESPDLMELLGDNAPVEFCREKVVL